MDIYERKSRWKLYLAVAGAIVILISMFYTYNLAEKLAEGETMKVELWINSTKALGMGENFEEDVTQAHQVTQIIDDIPLILVGDNGIITDTKNFPETLDEEGFPIQKELDKLEPRVQELKKQGRELTLETSEFTQFVYYGHSQTYTLLKYFPILQVLLIAGFIAFGYFSFSSSRRAEQNQVWVGMAKETAHQLGTPISAIMGWIDHLKDMYGSDEYMLDVVEELKKDTGRLELIADRFSKIGSEPKMESINIYEELESMRAYMQRRAARKIEFDFPDPTQVQNVNINPPLFNWVLENLLRNALDAMGGKGKISAKVYKEKNLAKRIIESYHSGRIFVSKSVPNEQTTFTIKLPVNHHVRGEIKIK